MTIRDPENRTRREQIALAALELIAESGLHGMTHRQVDKRLGLVEGSTSAYFRRREDLMVAAFDALMQISVEDFDHHFAPVLRRLDRGQAITVAEVAGCQASFWRYCQQPENRFLTVARFDFFLESVRNEKFGDRVGSGLNALSVYFQRIMESLGARNVDVAILEVGRIWRGDLFSTIFVRPISPRIDESYYERLYRAALKME